MVNFFINFINLEHFSYSFVVVDFDTEVKRAKLKQNDGPNMVITFFYYCF